MLEAQRFLYRFGYFIATIMIVVAVLFSPSIDVLVVVVSFAAIVVAHVVYERTKRLKASTPASRRKWILPFLLLMYCSFALELVFLFQGNTLVLFGLFSVTSLSLVPIGTYTAMFTMKTIKMR